MILYNKNMIKYPNNERWILNRDSFLERLFYSLFHFIAGITSKIPICCNLYWCYIWIFYSHPRKNNLFNEIDEFTKRSTLAYFPCPICFKRKHFVQIKWDKKDDIYYYNEFQDLYIANPNIQNDFI